jgi:hypothetical protein
MPFSIFHGQQMGKTYQFRLRAAAKGSGENKLSRSADGGRSDDARRTAALAAFCRLDAGTNMMLHSSRNNQCQASRILSEFHLSLSWSWQSEVLLY